jgi:leucyl aminopeptidase
MTSPVAIDFAETDTGALAAAEGRLAVVVTPEGRLDTAGRRVNRLTRGALTRACAGRAFQKLDPGEALSLAFPAGLAAEALVVVKLPRRPDAAVARRAGGALARAMETGPLTACLGPTARPGEVALGLMLRAYAFTDHKTGEDAARRPGKVTFMVSKPGEAADAAAAAAALAEGVFFTRDLVNEPSNVLTTTEFADRLAALGEAGVDVEVLEEDALARLGMRALLGVGQGSDSPSKVVVMEWRGGGDAAPVALVGKGVVFDTGGISIKPASGMEEMTMDMGGAGVVAGVMRTLALRKAKANVVGLVGLVENMPSGSAQRPGDVVTSMKGDTIEVINTDAEGRLVLADVMWYAQDRFRPAAMVDLATLTGAIIIGLGNENAGVFSNNDAFCNAFLKAAAAEDEGAWRLPLGPAYDKLLKSAIADMKNVGGRAAGSITAAQFLQRFVRPETPWIHIDIAGVATAKEDGPLCPKGASGWGVRALDRMIRDRFEG